MKDKLKQLREKRGLSQAEVAQEIGISRQMYNKYERGDTEPSLSVIRAICQLYAISPNALLGQENMFVGQQFEFSEKKFPCSYDKVKAPEPLAVASPQAAYGTKNYFAEIMKLLPHLLLSEKSRLLNEVAQSMVSEVEGRKSQPMKIDQDNVRVPTYEEFQKGLTDLVSYTESIGFNTKERRWTREEMNER